MARAKPAKVTRILHSQGLHKAKSVHREHIAERADRVSEMKWPVHGATDRPRQPRLP